MSSDKLHFCSLFFICAAAAHSLCGRGHAAAQRRLSAALCCVTAAPRAIPRHRRSATGARAPPPHTAPRRCAAAARLQRDPPARRHSAAVGERGPLPRAYPLCERPPLASRAALPGPLCPPRTAPATPVQRPRAPQRLMPRAALKHRLAFLQRVSPSGSASASGSVKESACGTGSCTPTPSGSSGAGGGGASASGSRLLRRSTP